MVRGVRWAHRQRMSKSGGERKVQAATKMRGLEHLQGRFSHQISGGQGG